jgi:hypothetical protein
MVLVNLKLKTLPTQIHFCKSASYLDLFLEITIDGRLQAKIYDKRDDFNFPIVNFPFPNNYKKNNQLICTISITITNIYLK